ncbi:MAG TPA: AraC family transcriptional regulator [Opitutaceae bacterium]
MLRYVGYGRREWRTAPMPKHRRVNWEFLATLNGEASPVIEGHAPIPRSGPTLWLFPPEVSHGWESDEAKGNDVVVLHYSGLDPFVEQIVRRDGWLAVPLSKQDVATINDMAKELWAHYWRPTVLGGFYADRALATLCLIALHNHPECRRPAAPKAAIATVEAAERWILSHVSNNRAVSEAAQAIGVSRAQLYRLIQQIRGCSPRRLLLRLRFETAKRIMSESDLKLDSVARECGFSDASAFCRAFRAVHGCSPAHWRTEYHICYRNPPAALRHDPGSHGHSIAVPNFELIQSVPPPVKAVSATSRERVTRETAKRK